MTKLSKGLSPVMLTPFNSDNTVDIGALKNLVDFYIDAGSDGLFANCLSSEMFQLTKEERILITQTVVNHAGSRAAVISTGSFGSSIPEMIDMIKAINDTGVKSVVLLTNALASPTESEEDVKSRLSQIMDNTGDIPLGLYECPVPYKRVISPDLVEWIAKTNRFLYHKDTCCDLPLIKKKIKAAEGSSFGIYNAHTPSAVGSLKAGALGLSPIGANLYPELFSFLVREYENLEEGKLEKLTSMLNIMDPFIHQDYPYIAKVFLQKRGFDINLKCRISEPVLNYDSHQKLDSLLFLIKDLSQELGIDLLLNS